MHGIRLEQTVWPWRAKLEFPVSLRCLCPSAFFRQVYPLGHSDLSVLLFFFFSDVPFPVVSNWRTGWDLVKMQQHKTEWDSLPVTANSHLFRCRVLCSDAVTALGGVPAGAVLCLLNDFHPQLVDPSYVSKMKELTVFHTSVIEKNTRRLQ